MTETTEQPTTSTRARKGEGLSAQTLPELKALAARLGLKGTSAMRKGDLVAAIASHQHTNGAKGPSQPAAKAPAAVNGRSRTEAADQQLPLDLPEGERGRRRSTRAAGAPRIETATAPAETAPPAPVAAAEAPAERTPRQDRGGEAELARIAEQLPPAGGQDGADRRDRDGDDAGRNRRNRRNRRDRDNRDGQRDNRSATAQGEPGEAAPAEREPREQREPRDAAGEDGSGRRNRRFRERNRRGRERFGDVPDTELREDDVLVPVAGIVDVLDSYAFIRTSGYLSGPTDVYVSLSQVRKYGLRRGDAVTGAVRAPREGEQQRQKFNALVRLDLVNGQDPDLSRQRPEFTKLTPLYPNERLRLETEPHLLTTRVIDLVMPVGKGQRALIVSPPKAGKTSILQAIANAIATNNPECHLMVVLVDERPEEVTDMQRSVKGEVIASTFDRPPSDHTMIAELAIERAKRLVELGKDVVVLLDSITRLGRAYNNSSPASGRILSGGVDSTALYPPKRFLGAARNIENGGSLTIFASALVETGSAGDTVIFEEFKGTGNAELKLDRKLADKRLFPAIDVDQSSTRKEELLMSPDERVVVMKLRRLLAALDNQQALELVLDRLRKTRTNVEFLMQVAKNTPGQDQ